MYIGGLKYQPQTTQEFCEIEIFKLVGRRKEEKGQDFGMDLCVKDGFWRIEDGVRLLIVSFFENRKPLAS